jgi:superfamily II RNA helicase
LKKSKRYRRPRSSAKRSRYDRNIRGKRVPDMRPGADRKLKPVFARIGTPPQGAFRPDPFQVRAVAAVETNDCLVTAPTGAGKTWIAQEAIDRVFKRGGRAWYASPLKALTNSKLVEFANIFGSPNVGILTGDRKENPAAPVIVGTTEILRNQLYDAMHREETLATDFVVLDEAHFLGDEDRGVVWEEIMIYLPQRIPLLLLSATIGNASTIAAWLTAIRGRQCILVHEDKRPVPLFPLVLHPRGTLLPLLVQDKDKMGSPKRIYKRVNALMGKGFRGFPATLPPFAEILRILRKYNLLPAIFFMKSRADCDRALEKCQDKIPPDSQHARRLSQMVSKLLGDHPHLARHRQRHFLENHAVAAHHSGQLPAWKLVVESLLTEGELDAVFATSTVAAGVNFPARSVVFLHSDRFNGVDFVPLGATEFHQMTGRAGRRGMDRIGFALILPGRYMDLGQIARLVKAPPAHVNSQIRINFSMVLNLLLSHTPNEIRDLLKRSLAAFTLSQKGPAVERDPSIQGDGANLWEDFLDHLDFLQATGFVDRKNRLLEDGRWAAQLRIDLPLMVAEGLRRRIFPQEDPVLMAAMMASFVNEKETDEKISSLGTPKRLKKSFLKVRKGLHGFARHMVISGFAVRPLYLKPAAIVFAWASGESWNRVVATGRVAEGDLAMLVMRTADNLRHIRALKKVFPEAASSAAKAIELLLREPVMPESSK